MAKLDDRFFNVNRDGSLRVPGVLWLAMAFLMRHLILVTIVFATAKRSPEVVRLLGGSFSWLVLPLELPVLVLILAAANRAPDAWKPWRAVWSRGRFLILAMAFVHIAWAGGLLATSQVWRPWPELFLASCSLLDLAIAYGIWKDDYYRQLFADFPAAAVAEMKS